MLMEHLTAGRYIRRIFLTFVRLSVFLLLASLFGCFGGIYLIVLVSVPSVCT